jgi:intein/homing endonuclease
MAVKGMPNDISKVIAPELIEKVLKNFRSSEEADLFIKALEELVGIGKSKIEDDLRSIDFIEKPVDMYTFMKDPYFLGIIDTLYPKIADDLIELFDPGNGYFLVLLGGSISLNTLVQEADGGLPTLRERLGCMRDVSVLLDSGLETSATEAAHDSGVKEVIRIALANGMGLDLTPDHKVRVYRDGYQWICADELVLGDLAVVARRLRMRPSSQITIDETKLLAYWVANGSSSETRARFSSGNFKTSNEVVDILRNLGFNGSLNSKRERCLEVSVSRVKRSGFFHWLRRHGADAKTPFAVVPDSVCRANNEVVKIFLNRLWACEGTVYAPFNGCSPPRFCLGMVSERFIRQVQLLLLRFGIRTRIREVKYFDKRKNLSRKIWHLTVTGADQLRTFLDTIGPIFGKEAACQRITEYCSRVKPNTNVDLLPITYGWLNDRMVESGIVRAYGNPWHRLSANRECRLSRSIFSSWLSDYGDTALGKILREEFPEDLAYEPVVSIEPMPICIPVGDVGAFNGNRFIANGINVHNSIGWGKCLAGDSLVWTDEGPLRIDKIHKEHLKVNVYGFDEENRLVEVKLIASRCDGVRPVFKLLLASGCKLRATAEHPFLARDGWKRLNELKTGDLVATARRLPLVNRPAYDFVERLKTANGNSNVDVVPIDYDRLNELRRTVGGTSRQIWNKVKFPKGQLLGRSKWDSVLKLLGNRVPEKFLRLGSGDLFWDRVKLIKYAGEEEVYDLDVPKIRNFIANGIVVHNSTFSEIAMARVLYEVSCLKNPQQTYRMVKEDKLFFATVSITHTQAKRVIFEGLKGKIKGGEYFRTVFPYQDFATELRFPNNILLAASTQSQVIGMNTFSAVMDEANFMPVVERSTTAKLRGNRKVYDQAEVVFTALLRRMETRYLRFGNLPGKLFALSSAQYPDDFMERKINLYQGNKNAFIRNYAVWETKPKGTYGKEKFYIVFNRESGLGRIKREDEEAGPEEDTIEVPLEFKHDFEVDMEGSLRDLAGRPTLAIEPFLTKRDMIVKMYEDGRRHPFSVYETTLRDGGYVLRDIVCQWVKEEDDVGNVLFEGLRPKVNPKARRFIHIDHGLTGDACFPAGTKIRTPDGAFKRIEQIIIGDEVITHSGRSQKVMKLWKRGAEDLVSISTVGGKEVKCTKNHPILCFKKRQIKDNWEAFRGFKSKRPVPNFVKAEDIEVGDYLVVPIQSYNDVADLNCNGHRLILDYDLGWVFGMFLAEGHYFGHARLEKKWGIAFSLNQKEEKYAEEIIRIFREKFLVSKWNIFRRHDSKSMTLRFPMNRVVAGLFKWACGEYYHSKILNPTLIRNGNVNFYSGIIHGWISGDGTGMVRNKKSDRIPNCVSGKTVSEKLAWQLEQLYLRIGLRVRLYNVKSLRGKCKLPGYRVSVFGEDIRFFGFSPFFKKKRSMSLIFDGYMIVPVKSCPR